MPNIGPIWALLQIVQTKNSQYHVLFGHGIWQYLCPFQWQRCQMIELRELTLKLQKSAPFEPHCSHLCRNSTSCLSLVLFLRIIAIKHHKCFCCTLLTPYPTDADMFVIFTSSWSRIAMGGWLPLAILYNQSPIICVPQPNKTQKRFEHHAPCSNSNRYPTEIQFHPLSKTQKLHNIGLSC